MLGLGRFGERVAHGMMVMSYAVGLMPFDPDRVVALRGFDSVSFKRPVRIGDTIRLRSRVDDVRELDPEHSLVTLAWTITNQDGRAVARARVGAIWRVAKATPNPEQNGVARDADLYGERVLL